jgi:hypothetical protein
MLLHAFLAGSASCISPIFLQSAKFKSEALSVRHLLQLSQTLDREDHRSCRDSHEVRLIVGNNSLANLFC